MKLNAFLCDNLCDISINHWKHVARMPYTHTHPQYEVYFCSDNVEQRSVINGVEYRYKHPCVIISSPYTVHSMSCEDVECEHYERFVIYFNENIIDQIGPGLLPPDIISKNIGYMFKLTDEDAESLKKFLISFNPCNKTDHILLLAAFLNKLVTFSPIEDAVCIGKSSIYIQEVLQYISEHIGDQISSDILAKNFSVSRSKLDRDFKLTTGITVHSFTDICRINKAKNLLTLNRLMPIFEISSACGFSSETYFFPFFKKNVGMTPIEYRKKHVNDK